VFKGTLPYPKPTQPRENPRHEENSKSATVAQNIQKNSKLRAAAAAA
jgi:hypothetical protein